jgi:hypothetical protein
MNSDLYHQFHTCHPFAVGLLRLPPFFAFL